MDQLRDVVANLMDRSKEQKKMQGEMIIMKFKEQEKIMTRFEEQEKDG